MDNSERRVRHAAGPRQDQVMRILGELGVELPEDDVADVSPEVEPEPEPTPEPAVEPSPEPAPAE